MPTSLSTGAPPGPHISPNVPQSSWSGSPAVQSPSLPPHQVGHGGVGADAASFFAPHPMAAAEGQGSQQVNGVYHPPPKIPNLQNRSIGHPPGAQPNLPQSGQRHPSQDVNTPQPQPQGYPGLVRSDTGPGTNQQASDKSQTDEYTAIADAIKSADRSILRQVVRDHWDLFLLGSDYHLAFFVRFFSEPIHSRYSSKLLYLCPKS